MKPLTEEWIAGFIQAEGYAAFNPLPKPHIAFGVSQLDCNGREVLQHISNCWCTKNFHPQFNLSTKESTKGKMLNLNVFRKEECRALGHLYLPYLYKPKRQDLYKKFELEDEPKHLPLSWEFLAGFWEGDGSVAHWFYRHLTSVFALDFYQDDAQELLLDIKTLLGRGGSLMDGTAHLRITDSKKEGLPLHFELLKHTRMSFRRDQLIKNILAYEQEKTEMSNTQIISRYRELILV